MTAAAPAAAADDAFAPSLRATLAATLLTPLMALAAPAQTAAPDAAAGHGHAMPAATPGTPASTAAYRAAMEKMHTGMAIAHTGNADVDFVRGMIPHHRGAIDMARIVLEHGSDPEVRAMAEEIVAAQEAEIAAMQDWLERNAPDAAQADAARMESMAAGPVTGAAPESRPAGVDASAARPPEARPATPPPAPAPDAPPSN